jgi:lipoprotein-anchoring transpeptidase ErfK/SrfK
LTAVLATTRLRRAAVAAPLLLGGLGGCGGERPQLADETSTTTTEPSSTTTVPEPEAEVAKAKEPAIDVFASDDATEPERQIVAGVDTSDDTIPVVFLVKRRAPDADRLEVHLPVAPSGSVGWVDAADVDVTAVPYRIEVDLSDHRLQVLDDDEVVLDASVGVGRTDRPEPGGVYYLRELVTPPDPDGPYGAYAYGLSGFPPVLAGVEAGVGVVGIHGTDQPGGLGTDVADGSIILDDDAITRLVEEIGLPLGTPVEVEA